MTLNDTVKLAAGIFILISLFLGQFINTYFFFFTAFVGANLLQSSITKWCFLEKILMRFGFREVGDS